MMSQIFFFCFGTRMGEYTERDDKKVENYNVNDLVMGVASNNNKEISF